MTTDTKLTVCYVDDSESMRRAAVRVFEQLGVNYLIENDTFRALSTLSERKVDVIFCDVTIPPINGFEFCRVVKETKHLASIPLVFVTTRTGIVDQARAELVGGVGYVTKPFAADDFEVVLNQFSARRD